MRDKEDTVLEEFSDLSCTTFRTEIFFPNLAQPMSEFEIAPGKYIGGKFPCFIIAEIGQNHQGDVEIAKQLIQTAADCGVDCVKFQKSDMQSRFTKEVLKRPYIGHNSWGATYGEHRKHLELSEDDYFHLKQYADGLGICFTASGMDKPSIDFLYSLGVPFFKIGSADCTNMPLLRHVSKYQKPLVISTGMNNKANICKMYDDVSKVSKSVALLQCTSCYPTPPCHVNLNVIKAYRKLFPQAVIGYSGHETGTGISLAAIACGAKILERHITMSHSLKGSDHVGSLEPTELKQLVHEVRRIEEAMGSCLKKVQYCEQLCYEKLGKTVVTTRYLTCGTILEEDMIDIKVAIKKGYDAVSYDSLIGRKLKRNLDKEDTILPDDLV